MPALKFALLIWNSLNRPRFVKEFFLFAVLTMSLSCAADPAGGKPLILAVHPYLPTEEIVSRFTPLANYLGRAIGRPVEVRVGRDYAEHMEAIGSDSVDIAYIGPSLYVEMIERYGMKPLLVRQEVNNQPYLSGEIVVRQDSPIQTLADLKGKSVIFGDPNSTMSFIVPKRMLELAGVPLQSLGSYQHVEGHKNVALAVLAGDFDAGAVKDEVFAEYSKKGLRSLAHSPMVADHLFLTSNKLPTVLVDRLRSLMLNLNESPQGKSIMKAIHPQMTRLVPASDGDYDSLRRYMGPQAPSKRH
jgi:phosphonate transport system substrate-binding protein